jgi:hypothetical protein
VVWLCLQKASLARATTAFIGRIKGGKDISAVEFAWPVADLRHSGGATPLLL